MTKYKLTEETKKVNGVTLHRIELVEDCKWGKAGEKGGWIEKESNLREDAWVGGNAHVFGKARVFGKALVSENARVGGEAWVSENAHVFGNAHVSGYAHVFGNARMFGNIQIFGKAFVYGNAQADDKAMVFDNGCLQIFKIIKDYLENTPSEVLDKDFAEINALASNGISFEDYVHELNKIRKC